MPDAVTVTVAAAYVGDKIVLPFANKLLGYYADDLKKLLDGRSDNLMQKTARILLGIQQEPQPVPLKTLRPLVEGAVLEEEESMVDRWAALLANAARPEGRSLVEPSFAEVLRQLTPVQALILEQLYAQVDPEKMQEERSWYHSFTLSKVQKQVGLSFMDFERCMDNLIRLRLCTRIVPARGAANATTHPLRVTFPTTEPTMFGYAFVQACTVPVASP